MISTRPDLAFAIGKLSQFCHDPTVRHTNTLSRVLRYIAGTTKYGLHFRKNEGPVIYSDSAYSDNRTDRKLTHGYVLLYNDAAYI